MSDNNNFRLSVSKVKCFNQCKKQYEFSYILKMPKKERDYHIFGKFAHKVLEDFHQEYIDGTTEPYNKTMSVMFKRAQQEYKTKMTPQMIKECYNLINDYLKIVYAQKDTKGKVVAVEKNFELNISDNVVLNGMIDRIQVDTDNIIHVMDYKTTKNKKYLKDDWMQLLTYAYVIASENPTIDKVRASYILLRHNFEHITKEFNIEQIAEVKDKYLEYANQILSEKQFEASPSVLCSYCDFLSMCEQGKQKVSPNVIYGEVSW